MTSELSGSSLLASCARYILHATLCGVYCRRRQVVDKAASTKRLSKRTAFADVFSFKSYVSEVDFLANVHSANSTRFAEVGESIRDWVNEKPGEYFDETLPVF